MLKIIAACGSGMGSSQIIKMKIGNVFRWLGVPAEQEIESKAREAGLV